MGIVRQMAEPRLGVYFLVGMAFGLIVSFLFPQTLQSPYAKIKGSAGIGIDPRKLGDSIKVNTDSAQNDGKQTCDCSNVKPEPCLPRDEEVMTHDQVDKINKHDGNVKGVSEDKHEHHDNDAVARRLYNEVKVLVWVMTQPSNLMTKAIHVNHTWGKRANKVLYASDSYNASFPTMPFHVEAGRGHLTAKTMAAFDYVHDNYLDQYDWFMKADDDTYVIMENLRYFLSSYDPSEPVYFGHFFKVIIKQGYYSGGGGYVLSKEALRRFGNRSKKRCADDNGAEDVELGRCMERLGVKTQESLDKLGRTRFHCFNPGTHLHGGFPDWYLKYDKYDGVKKGVDSISDYPITFHYVSVKEMYALEYYTYHLSPYGIQFGLQDLNIPREKKIKTLQNTSANVVCTGLECKELIITK